MGENSLPEAARYLDAACDLYRDGSLRRGPHFASLLKSLATLRNRMGDVPSARSAYEEVHDILEAGLPVNQDDARTALGNAASFFSRTSDARSAVRADALRGSLKL